MDASYVVRLLAVVAALVASGAGCERATSGPAAQAVAARPPAQAAEVAQVVFVDRERCCDCTRKQIDASWQALQNVVQGRDGLKVVRLHQDTQPTEVEMLQLLRPMQFVPALYVLDADGGLIELLQGPVAEEALRRALGPTGEQGA